MSSCPIEAESSGVIGTEIRKHVNKGRKVIEETSKRLERGYENGKLALAKAKVEINRKGKKIMKETTEAFAIASQRIEKKISKQKAKINRVVRKAVTGDPNKRVRDHIQEEPMIRFFDKMSFVCGVGFLIGTQHTLLLYPQYFWVWYSAIIFVLLVLRWFYYTHQKLQYFMYDFCYFHNVLMFSAIGLSLGNEYIFENGYIEQEHFNFHKEWLTWLWEVIFVLSNGPLLFAIIVWRNSFVFHSIDKITSLFIHALPPLLTYCLRTSHIKWVPLRESDHLSDLNVQYVSTFLAWPLVFYLVWQALYFIKTDVIDYKILSKDLKIHTSIRWLTRERIAKMEWQFLQNLFVGRLVLWDRMKILIRKL